MSSNPVAAIANFGAATVHAFGAGAARTLRLSGVAGSLPMNATEQWLYGFGTSYVIGLQIASASGAVYMSRSTPSANGGQSDNSVEMQALNAGSGSSAVPPGNSEAGTLLRESN
ncbi:hypothetical protein [Pseudomonas peradeniyensis]|nr:hypothetical protein [Pseudomonas peradeniyensis]